MKHDDFGNRMKAFESVYTDARIPIELPMMVRVDGKGFSKFTKGFNKPFDDDLSGAMIAMTKQLVKETGADFGYTQSDETSLVFFPRGKQSEHYLGGKVSKVNSIVASMASVTFNHFIMKSSPVAMAGRGLPYFDCRVWSVDSDMEAMNTVLWRMQDAKRNSISSLCHNTMGHKKMQNLSGDTMISTMKADYDVDWFSIPDRYRFGTIVTNVAELTELDADIVATIPVDKRPINNMVMRNKIYEEHAGEFMSSTIEERLSMMLHPNSVGGL